MDFAYELREKIKLDIFELDELKVLFHPLSDIAIQNRVARSFELLKLRRGLYLFSKKLRKRVVFKFTIANRLYRPSYVSFESALSHHGLIPEAVHTTTSACFKRKNKIFSNSFGDFSFDYIPSRPFFMGVYNSEKERIGLVANVFKSLFDLICLRRKHYQSLNDLKDDLRIDEDVLQEEITHFSVKELKMLAKSYKKKNVDRLCEILVEELK